SRLTLNLGLRYELATPLYEKQNRIANLDVASSFTAVAPVLPDEQGPYSEAVESCAQQGLSSLQRWPAHRVPGPVYQCAEHPEFLGPWDCS
ncbi:MAG: hypothetical protein ACRD2L_20620, partial [Terriglobia bacterium]